MVSIMVMSFFCFLGVYSQILGFRLYTHPKISQMLKYPVKWKRKVFIGLSFALLVAFILILNLSTLNYIYGKHPHDKTYNVSAPDNDDPLFDSIFNGPNTNPCQIVQLHTEICQIYWLSQSVFSVFFVFWNVLVVIALLVSSRKVKNDISNLNIDLQEEVFRFKAQLRESFGNKSWLDSNEHLWIEENTEVFSLKETGIINNEAAPNEKKPKKSLIDIDCVKVKYDELDDIPIGPNTSLLISNQELMGRYWDLAVAARLISLAFQKWMGSIVGMVSTWSAIRCAYWFSNPPTWYGIFMFIIPLFIIPVLASAYAEVNYEGGLIPRSIFPVEERLQLFQYISEQPIVMNVYNHNISYSTIGTVVAGVLAAFGSKIILQEMFI